MAGHASPITAHSTGYHPALNTRNSSPRTTNDSQEYYKSKAHISLSQPSNRLHHGLKPNGVLSSGDGTVRRPSTGDPDRRLPSPCDPDRRTPSSTDSDRHTVVSADDRRTAINSSFNRAVITFNNPDMINAPLQNRHRATIHGSHSHTRPQRAARNGDYIRKHSHQVSGNVWGKRLQRSSSDLDLESDRTDHNTSREYGSTASVNQLKNNESFFTMLKDLNVASNDQRSHAPPQIQDILRGSVPDDAQYTHNTANTSRSDLDHTDSPKVKLKQKQRQKDRKPRAKSITGDTTSNIFKKLRSKTDTSEFTTKNSDSPLDIEIKTDDRNRRKAFVHFDCQSIITNLNGIGRNKNIGMKRRNTTTGASAASSYKVTNIISDDNDDAPTLGDEGDDKNNDLVLSCPFFRNEIGGEPERTINLTQSDKRTDTPVCGMRRSPLSCGIAVLDPSSSPDGKVFQPYRSYHGHIIEFVDTGAHYYRHFFKNYDHMNYLGVDPNLGPVALSVRRELQDVRENYSGKADYGFNQYRLICRSSELTTLRGAIIEEAIPCQSRLSNTRGVPVKDVLEYVLPDLNLSTLRLAIPGPKTTEQLVKLDEQGTSTTYKVGVMLCRSGQSTEEDMYNNENSTDAFDEFLECIGRKVRLKGFQGYRAQLDNQGDTAGTHSIYAQFAGYEIMFHVSTMLPFTQNNRQQLPRKRHIGNDIVTIIFQEPGALPFTPKTIRSQFQHVFIIVRVHSPNTPHTQYSVAVSRSKDVPSFGPPIPTHNTFNKSQDFANFLLAKVINAENAAHHSEKFIAMAARTRQEYLKDLCSNYISTTTLDTGSKLSKFSLGSGKKKDRQKTKPVPDYFSKAAVIWSVQVENGSTQHDCHLAIASDAVVVIDDNTKDVVFTVLCRNVIGWMVPNNRVRCAQHDSHLAIASDAVVVIDDQTKDVVFTVLCRNVIGWMVPNNRYAQVDNDYHLAIASDAVVVIDDQTKDVVFTVLCRNVIGWMVPINRKLTHLIIIALSGAQVDNDYLLAIASDAVVVIDDNTKDVVFTVLCKNVIGWMVPINRYAQVDNDYHLAIAGDAVVIDDNTKDVVFTVLCRNIIGWMAPTNSGTVKLYYKNSGCLVLRPHFSDDSTEIATRLAAVTPGSEAQEMNLKRNGLGQLGFHIHSDCHVSDVEPYSFAWQAGLRQGSLLVEICKISMATMNHDQIVDLLRTSSIVCIAVIPPNADSLPRFHSPAIHSNFSSITTINSLFVDAPTDTPPRDTTPTTHRGVSDTRGDTTPRDTPRGTPVTPHRPVTHPLSPCAFTNTPRTTPTARTPDTSIDHFATTMSDSFSSSGEERHSRNSSRDASDTSYTGTRNSTVNQHSIKLGKTYGPQWRDMSSDAYLSGSESAYGTMPHSTSMMPPSYPMTYYRTDVCPSSWLGKTYGPQWRDMSSDAYLSGSESAYGTMPHSTPSTGRKQYHRDFTTPPHTASDPSTSPRVKKSDLITRQATIAGRPLNASPFGSPHSSHRNLAWKSTEELLSPRQRRPATAPNPRYPANRAKKRSNNFQEELKRLINPDVLETEINESVQISPPRPARLTKAISVESLQNARQIPDHMRTVQASPHVTSSLDLSQDYRASPAPLTHLPPRPPLPSPHHMDSPFPLPSPHHMDSPFPLPHSTANMEWSNLVDVASQAALDADMPDSGYATLQTGASQSGQLHKKMITLERDLTQFENTCPRPATTIPPTTPPYSTGSHAGSKGVSQRPFTSWPPTPSSIGTEAATISPPSTPASSSHVTSPALAGSHMTNPVKSFTEENRRTSVESYVNSQERTHKTSLQQEVDTLKLDNLRLQHESQAAAAQLRKFTEWFFSNIDKR